MKGRASETEGQIDKTAVVREGAEVLGPQGSRRPGGRQASL